VVLNRAGVVNSVKEYGYKPRPRPGEEPEEGDPEELFARLMGM